MKKYSMIQTTITKVHSPLLFALMFSIIPLSFFSCDKSEDDSENIFEEPTAKVPSAMKKLKGAWQLTNDKRIERKNDGTERVMWDESASDYILIFSAEQEKFVYAHQDHEDRTGKWSTRVLSYTYIDGKNSFRDSEGNLWRIVSTGSNELVLENSYTEFTDYIRFHIRTYKKLDNPEEIVGDIDWGTQPKVDKECIKHRSLLGYWNHNDYYTDCTVLFFKSDGSYVSLRVNAGSKHSGWERGTWTYDADSKIIATSQGVTLIIKLLQDGMLTAECQTLGTSESSTSNKTFMATWALTNGLTTNDVLNEFMIDPNIATLILGTWNSDDGKSLTFKQNHKFSFSELPSGNKYSGVFSLVQKEENNRWGREYKEYIYLDEDSCHIVQLSGFNGTFLELRGNEELNGKYYFQE